MIDKPIKIDDTYHNFNGIIGDSPAIERTKELAEKIAKSNSTVLLTGESGTGKELFAQAIHNLSARSTKPFIPINCAAIPDVLFESELFGYEAGAFSGALRGGKPGKIELSQQGTLFLDEISELSYESQGKLLRVIQERELERLGGIKSMNLDIRIITATNRDLRTMVDEKKFRQDLYFRLYVFELYIPPLRYRKEDIIPITYHFINQFNQILGLNVIKIASSLETWLLNHSWPGNIRELKATIERGMNIVEGDTLTLDCIQFSARMKKELSFVVEDQKGVDTIWNKENYKAIPLEETLAKTEKLAIEQALNHYNGDKTLAAKDLQIHVTSLYRKMAKYDIK